MIFFTSHYNSVYTHTHILSLVSISQTVPKWFKIPVKPYTYLAPPWELLLAYKEGLCDWNRYVKIYNMFLDARVDPRQVLIDIPERSVLLCWEKDWLECHRYLFAVWFMKRTGHTVEER